MDQSVVTPPWELHITDRTDSPKSCTQASLLRNSSLPCRPCRPCCPYSTIRAMNGPLFSYSSEACFPVVVVLNQEVLMSFRFRCELWPRWNILPRGDAVVVVGHCRCFKPPPYPAHFCSPSLPPLFKRCQVALYIAWFAPAFAAAGNLLNHAHGACCISFPSS